MRHNRRQAAAGLNKKEKDRTSTLTDVLLFFETVGLLERRKALDREMAWSLFSYPAFRYWTAARQFIDDDRAEDDTVWEDFVRLIGRLKDMEARRRHRKPESIHFATDDIEEFLEEETKLPIVGAAEVTDRNEP